MTNGIKHEDSPPPVKKQADSSLTDIEEAIPDTTNDQKIMDRVLDKTRCVSVCEGTKGIIDFVDVGLCNLRASAWQTITICFCCCSNDRGFVKYSRSKAKYRPPKQRMKDWNEVYYNKGKAELKVQAAR